MDSTTTLRRVNRWLMAGPRRQQAFRAAHRAGTQLLDGKIRRGPARGLRFHGGDTAGYVLGLSEPAVQQALADHLKPGMVFYDIGANIGFHTVLACRLVGPTGEVHCFEPLEANLRQLQDNLHANDFTAVIHAVALSNTAGQALMSAPDGWYGRAHFSRGREHEHSNADLITVPTIRLDDLDVRPPNLIKMDVEGAEGQVLRGMPRILAEDRPVLIIEVHPGHEGEVRSTLEAGSYELREITDDGGMPHILATPFN